MLMGEISGEVEDTAERNGKQQGKVSEKDGWDGSL